MKTLRQLIAILVILPLAVASCIKSPDGPPLNMPVYDGPEANRTIDQIKAEFDNGTGPQPIEYAYIVKAVVTGNDETGNIYKQMYIQDETGAINIGVDQNDFYTTYRIGQEIYLNLHGLSVITYGGEKQIGYDGTSANRIPWEIFEEQVSRNGWPDKSDPWAQPEVVTIPQLSGEGAAEYYVNRLVTIQNVKFVNGGTGATYALEDGYGNEDLTDASGNTITVRTSNYSDFAKEELPEGWHSVTGILGRYNGAWQMLLRNTDDVVFTGEGGGSAEETVFFYETFGTTAPSTTAPRPTPANWDDMREKNVTYTVTTYTNSSGIEEGTVDVRATQAFDNHAWFKAGESYMKIDGINTTGGTGMNLSFQITANVYADDEAQNVNSMQVFAGSTQITLPDFELTRAGGYTNAYYTVTVGIPDGTTSLEFKTDATANALGMRLDNIQIYSTTALEL